MPIVEDYPNGYPQLACFQESDESFMIYRRFGGVFSRLLLNKQDELRTMEDTLFELDMLDDTEVGGHVYLTSRKADHRRNVGKQATRTQLLVQMEKKALEYSEYFSFMCNRLLTC